MEALKQIACIPSAGMDAQKLCWNGNRVSFVDKGHVEFYRDGLAKKKKEKVGIKKKLKLLKGLSKDLSAFSGMGFAIDQDHDLLVQVRGKMITEAAEVLLKQLEQLKAEEKELKRKRKQEKAKLKAKMSTESESSDSECEDDIIQANCLISEPLLVEKNKRKNTVLEDRSLQVVGTSCGEEGMTKRVEVCMGNKCKKSGGEALLQEFQRVIGVEGNVVGCKCMGKCRDGPNVRLCNSGNQQTPANPLCIGVGLEDVGAIVGNFLAQDSKNLELGLSVAS